MEKIKILHTADLHLGRGFGVSEKFNAYQDLLWKSLNKMVETATEREADLFLLAGDTFDNQFPGQEVVAKLATYLTPLKDNGIKAIMIPGTGTHDSLKPKGILKSEIFQKNLSWVVLLTPERMIENFRELDCSVEAWFGHSDRKGEVLKPEPERRAGAKFKIGLAHGSMATLPWLEGEDLLIIDSLIEQSGLHYLALGHWHNFQAYQYQSGKTIVAYSGSPEPTLREFELRFLKQGDKDFQGSAIWIEISQETGTKVEPLKVGNLEPNEVEIEVDKAFDLAYLEQRLTKFSGPERILFLKLVGKRGLAQELSEEKLLSNFTNYFFWIRIIDQTERELSEVKPEDLKTELEREFYRIMIKKFESASGDQKTLYEEAIRKGLSLIKGIS